MRYSEKSAISGKEGNQLFGVDFHDFIQRENDSTLIELASEYGLAVKDIKKLKKHLHRS
ncbi:MULTISPECIES: hypothetical protein [Bacillaceae]|uniref:hypothetical protein n=1 Tax=Bacillaceae TaxID=186817 RepID=UPI001BDF2520|nr:MULTISPECIES: hypothetical protein [unclassified Cytobacillus]MDX8359456.1 hypothetical protein [Cytobacillus sp. IB215316]MDX8364092.1 hypothetical protein [Cytobacillus sp. IB215665]